MNSGTVRSLLERFQSDLTIDELLSSISYNLLVIKILLGLVHALPAGGQPHHPTSGYIVLQRRPEHPVDRLQLP